ncbi:hypothetical protein LSAT2_027005 [Lamellibrachia satsuma]|nr:hypothetical protein LSAT2_027005 [Lamellibrachia satsuma]
MEVFKFTKLMSANAITRDVVRKRDETDGFTEGFIVMATKEDEATPRSMIGQFLQHHQSSKTAQRPGLRNRPRSTSLGVGAQADTQTSGGRKRAGQRSHLSTSELTPHNAIDQFLQISKTTEPTKRKRAISAKTPAVSQASSKAVLSSSLRSTTVGCLRSAAGQVHKPTPRSMISAFVHQAVEETPVAVTGTSISYLDATFPGSEVAPKRRKSIKEESFLEYLDLENEDVQPVQRERSRTRRTRTRLSAFEVASKLAVDSLKKVGKKLIVTAEVHRPQGTPLRLVEHIEEPHSATLPENQTDSPDRLKETDECESSVSELSRRSSHTEASSVSPRTLVTRASPRTSNTPGGHASPRDSMALRLSPKSALRVSLGSALRVSPGLASRVSPRSLGTSKLGKASTSPRVSLSPRQTSLRGTSLSPRRTSLSPNATLEKTPASVSKMSLSKTTAGSFVAAVSPADGRESGGSNQEDLSQVTEGDPAEDPSPAGGDEVEGDMVGNNEEETNYNKSLLSYFRQQTQASHSDNLYSTVERTAAVNSVDNRDSAVDDDGHVADGDSWHGDDHVDIVPSEGEVSTGDRLTTTACQSKTPNIFEAAKQKSNMPILWRSPTTAVSRSGKEQSRVKVTHSEPWLWEKKKLPPTVSRIAVAPKTQILQKSQMKTKKLRRADPSFPRLPASLTRSIFAHFSRHSRMSRATIDEVEKVADIYWKNAVSDLATYAKHANRASLLEADVELLLKRQRFVTEKTTMYTLVEKYLSLEHRQEIIPMARTGNKVVPKH